VAVNVPFHEFQVPLLQERDWDSEVQEAGEMTVLDWYLVRESVPP